MKKTILITLLALLGIAQSMAQEYEYVPFVREGVKWVYGIFNDDPFYGPDPNFPVGITYLTLEFKGDTVINGKTYKAMHKYSGKSINQENDTIPVYMREENKVVYGIVPDGIFYNDCPIGLWVDQEFYDLKSSGEEFVLYDFNDPIAFCDLVLNEKNDYFGEYQHLYTDTIIIGNHKVKRYVGSFIDNFYNVEGIGYDGVSCYPLFLWWNLWLGAEAQFGLSHVVKDGEIIYKGMRYRNGAFTGIDKVVTEQPHSPYDSQYYNLMGQPVGKDVPTTPGIYIHNGKKIVVR